MPSDGRPVLSAARRDELFARALVMAGDRKGFVARAQEQLELDADISAASAEMLRRADVSVSVGVRTHLEALPDRAEAFRDAADALIGWQTQHADSMIEALLAERVETVAVVEGGARLVAMALVGQPQIVIVHDDLVHPSPVDAALVIRALAPMTALVIVSDHPLVLRDAAMVAITTCTASAFEDELALVLDRALA